MNQMMTDALLVINTQRPDHNTVRDIAEALELEGLAVHEFDDVSGTIRVSGANLDCLKYIDGVDYIRPLMYYEARVCGDREDEI